jgi:hypothetical protein
MRFPALSRRAGLLAVAVAVASCGLAPAACAEEELHLASGEVVTGELITETATTIEIRRQVLIKHNAVAASVTIDKDQITRREKVASFADQYKARQKTSPDTLEGHIALARWSADHCLVAEAAQNAQRADDLDSDNPLVSRLFNELGYVKIKDQFVREDEYLAKNGLVDYQGKIMTPAEAEKAKAIYLANQEHDDATQAIKDDQFYLAHGDEKVKELTDKLEKEKGDASKAKGDVTAAKARIDADNKRQADLDAQQQQQAANGNNNGNGNGGYNNRRNQQQQLTPAQQIAKDLADANTALSKATDDQRTADRLVASDQRKLATLQAAVAKAKDDLPAQQDRLKKADADILELTGKAPPPPPSDDKTAAGTGTGAAAGAGAAATATPAPKSRFGN